MVMAIVASVLNLKALVQIWLGLTEAVLHWAAWYNPCRHAVTCVKPQ
jgi:hypothetical protein